MNIFKNHREILFLIRKALILLIFLEQNLIIKRV